MCIATRYTNSKGKTSEHGQTSKYNSLGRSQNTICGLRTKQRFILKRINSEHTITTYKLKLTRFQTVSRRKWALKQLCLAVHPPKQPANSQQISIKLNRAIYRKTRTKIYNCFTKTITTNYETSTKARKNYQKSTINYRTLLQH